MLREDNEKVGEVLKRIKKHSGHKNIRIVNRGNAAVFCALMVAKRINPRPYVLIPDQGGLTCYKKCPSFYNFAVKEVKTNYGIIDIEDLKLHAKTASALLYPAMAGYFAMQEVKSICKACRNAGCLVIMDVSACFPHKKLCKGKFADLLTCGFSHGEAVNYGYGGFVSSIKPEYLDAAKDAFSLFKVHPQLTKEIMPFISPKRVEGLVLLAEKVKKDLKKYDILHKDRKGINVVVKFTPDIIGYCQKKGYKYNLCPSYSRVNEKAISIELKAQENGEKK
ncbi:MAG: hypothetical protein ABIB71_08510 [Candidatus Woesearchaeota archaeon]